MAMSDKEFTVACTRMVESGQIETLREAARRVKAAATIEIEVSDEHDVAAREAAYRRIRSANALVGFIENEAAFVAQNQGART